jgi:hypothetical protein
MPDVWLKVAEKGDTGYSGVWLVAAGVPAGGTGNNGDMYLNSTTWDVYGPKSGGAWGAVVTNIKGAKGDKGDPGDKGDTGPAYGKVVLNGTDAPTTEGVDGDFYIRTTTNYIYGPKASGTWPAGVSLVGPTGPAGPATAGSIRSRATQSAPQTISNNSWTALEFGTNVYDVGGVHSESTNNTRFTVPTDGAGGYLATCAVTLQANNVGMREVEIRVSGVAKRHLEIPAGSGAYVSLCGVAELVLADADYVEFFVYQNGGVNQATVDSVTIGALTKLW